MTQGSSYDPATQTLEAAVAEGKDEVSGRPVAPGTRAANWIREKWGDQKPCPYCGGNSWVVTDAIRLAPEIGKEGDHMVFPVTCASCGNTVLVNANFPGSKG